MAEVIIKQHRFYWEDADYLVKLAREYEAKIDQHTADGEKEYLLYWKYRLARMSFIARMMAIEALLNNVLEQFSLLDKFPQLDILAEQFPRRERFPKIRRKRKGRPYQVPLKWKLYLAPYLCNDGSRMERDEYFHYEQGAYRKFRQLIMIRNEFVHTRVVERDIDIVMESRLPVQPDDPIGKMMVSQDFADCCEEMGITKDPICFKIDNAQVCGEAMRRIIVELNEFLDGRILTTDFWDSDELDFGK